MLFTVDEWVLQFIEEEADSKRKTVCSNYTAFLQHKQKQEAQKNLKIIRRMRMQKLFLSCLMVSIMAMPALAELNYPNIDVKGNLRFKSITANDYDCNKNVQDKEDNVQLTAYLKLSAELADKVGLKAVLKNVSAQGVTNSNDTLNTVLSQTTVYHIYFNVKDIAGVDAVIGRQNIGEKKNALVYQDRKSVV